MKKLLLLILVVSGSLGFSRNADAQEDTKFLDHLSVALNVSTAGPGLELATPINKHFALRAGFNVLPFSFPYDYSSGDLTLDVKAKVKLLNGNVLADWFPFEKAPFHLTAGLFLGSTEISAAGHSTEAFELGGWLIQPDEMGNIDVKIKGAPVKPYLGLGYGRSIPNSRFGFKMELGAMYHGSPKVTAGATGMISDTAGEAQKVQDNLKDYYLYPVLSFQLVYKIF